MNTPELHASLLQAMQTYFQGEKIEALVFILPLGLLCLAFSAWLFTDGGPGFARGVAIPFVLMGLVMGTVGAVVGLRTPAQVAALEAGLAAQPASTVSQEIARMEKVNAAWPRYLIAWALFGVVGLGLRFATRSEFLQGMGIALVFFAGVALLIDGFAERRTHPYVQALTSNSAAPGARS